MFNPTRAVQDLVFGYFFFSCSTQVNLKFRLPINIKIVLKK